MKSVGLVLGTRESDALAESDRIPDFRDIFDRYAPYAWRLLRRLGVADADAKDVCQEVFIIVHRKLSHIASASSVRGFVYGICVRTAADYRKSAPRRYERPSDAPPEQAEHPHDEAWLDRRRAIEALYAVLDRLDDTKREVFVLYELEGLPMTDVAATLGCPLQTAYWRLHAARGEIKAAFAERLQGVEA